MQMGPVANREQMNSILEYVSIGRQEGARLVTGGERLTQGELASGFYIAPTLFADVDNAMRIAQEEIFGPVLSFIRFRDEQDAIRIANDSRYGLSGGVFTGDLRKALRVAEAVRTRNHENKRGRRQNHGRFRLRRIQGFRNRTGMLQNNAGRLQPAQDDRLPVLTRREMSSVNRRAPGN